MRAISCIRVDPNRPEQAADLRAAPVTVEAGQVSVRDASDYFLWLRDDYLELVRQEKQDKVDRQKTDRHLSEDSRASEIPIVVTDAFPTGNGIFNIDGVAYAGQCLAEWIVFLTNRGSYASGPFGPVPRVSAPPKRDGLSEARSSAPVRRQTAFCRLTPSLEARITAANERSSRTRHRFRTSRAAPTAPRSYRSVASSSCRPRTAVT